MLWMAYLLSKLLPLAVLPIGLSLILLLVGLIARWRWPVRTTLLLLWVFSLGLVSQGLWRWLEAPWQRRVATAAPRADAIVVLSGGRHPAPGAARVSEWEDPDRFLAFKQDTTRKSFRFQFKVRARQNGLQEGGSSTATLAITNGELGPRETFLLTRVVVFDIGVSGRLGRLDPGIQQRVPFR